MDAHDRPGWPQRLRDLGAALVPVLAVAFALDLDRKLGLDLYDQQYLVFVLGLALALVFARDAEDAGPARLTADRLASVLALGAGGYLAWRYPEIVNLQFCRPWDGVLVGLVLIGLSLEALRRTVGWGLTAIAVVFLCYALLADLVPGPLAGRGADWRKLAIYLAVDVNGILGIPLKVAATVVVGFVLFGQLLLHSGGSHFFTDLAAAVMGRFRGGSAKIAVLASALFGSISGSAVANVVSTGIVTIPLMKRGGYPAHKAAAIEAAASTGGQIMPPVMGAAAFLMAEFLQVDYAAVVVAALVPALLYYLALFVQADLEAARENIPPVDPAARPRPGSVLRRGWYFPLPFAMLLFALFAWHLRPEAAVAWATGVLLLCTLLFGFDGRRPGPRELWRVLVETGRSVLDVVLVTTAAGMVIGVLALTGLGFVLTLLLVQIGEGSLWLLLMLAALVCIVLGMGLPTLGVYVLLATLVAPSLVEVGVSPMAAHLYVMYFGLMSMITPPIAIAAFAAASIAEARPLATALAATRFAWPAFVVPVLFVFSPSLLAEGSVLTVLLAAATAAVGVALISCAAVGHAAGPLSVPFRLGFAVAGLAALVPAEAVPRGGWVDLAGVGLGALLVVLGRRRSLRPDTHAPARRVTGGGDLSP